MNTLSPIPFDNTFIHLPERFYSRERPTAVADPRRIRTNPQLANQLGIDCDWLDSDAAVKVFAGNQILATSEPIATVYAGHQFGGWNPQLGDGRAILLGEVVDTKGQRYDIQLKGAGQTPYSRSGDGRSPLGPVLREYILSEAMAAMGIPSTRSLAAVSTGEAVYREQVLPGAVLARVARSHIRVGHFQFFSASGDIEALRLLADHLITRDFPEAKEAENPYLTLLEAAIGRQAQLIAQWQCVGFIHGVMNTDNMLICGETIDYGPCAFMDAYDPNACFSSIDYGMRYAYQNQPAIGQWNLSWFAQALLPLLADDKKKAIDLAEGALNSYSEQYQRAYTLGMGHKLGFTEATVESTQFIDDFLTTLATQVQDFTLSFRHLADLACPANNANCVNFRLPESFAPILTTWRQLLARQPGTSEQQQKAMYAVNPAYIPRNHRVEEAIDAAQSQGDLKPFHRLIEVLADPFHYHGENEDLARPPEPHEVVSETFCGT